MNPATVDLDAVDTCPLDAWCEDCGTRDDLDIATVGTPAGVYCLTLCRPCTDAGFRPDPGGWSAATNRVCEHCEHLGIDLDQIAAALDAERQR